MPALSEVSDLILGFYGTYSMVLSMVMRLGSPFLILPKHLQPQSQAECTSHCLSTVRGSEVKASKKLCRMAFACEADAQHGLLTSALGQDRVPTSYVCLVNVTLRQAGSPGQNILPAQAGSYIEEALASRAANHQALVAQPACCILPINELDDTQLPLRSCSRAIMAVSMGQCGFRFRKGPHFLAALIYLKTPERILALQIAMMACLSVSAALMYRLRKAFKGSGGSLQDAITEYLQS